MAHEGIPTEAPFVVDEERLAQDSAEGLTVPYATPASVREAFENIGKPEAADLDVVFPKNGQVYKGPFAEITAQHCPYKHLAGNWPTMFQQYVAMVEHFQKPQSGGEG